MNNVIIFDITQTIEKETFETMVKLLPQSRKEKYNSVKWEKQKLTTIYGYYIVKYLLNLKGCPDFQYTEKGKPFIDNQQYFNISHSGKYIVVATSNKPIGVDIEKPIKYRESLARYVSSKNQFNNMQKSSDKSYYLTKLWVTKESYIKLKASSVLQDLKKINLKEHGCKYTHFTYENYHICTCEFINNETNS